jgi:preprotein translocase subunit SecD
MLLVSVSACDGHSANVSGSFADENEAAIATILRTGKLTQDVEIVALCNVSARN